MIHPEQPQSFPRPFNENYELLGTLGKGGMGYVYKALDKKLKREVAFKILDSTSDEEAIKRFYLEAQAMKELDHQNIVHVFDFGQQDKQLFIAMTYVQGISLAEILQNKSKLSFCRASPSPKFCRTRASSRSKPSKSSSSRLHAASSTPTARALSTAT